MAALDGDERAMYVYSTAARAPGHEIVGLGVNGDDGGGQVHDGHEPTEAVSDLSDRSGGGG